MLLEAGRRLGLYEVLSPLGAGGMGEVYHARDTRLGRDVALKVFPAAFSDQPDRVSRFEREARLVASLNHPGIAAIHGFEEVDGIRFLVLELVPGETLAERLARGAPTLRAVLDASRQIAEALAEAHERGIIHRDIKPANIKLTADGKVKLLDFGLAKALDGVRSGQDLSRSPTVSLAGTREGVILGTAPYMSPEQARGEELDKRTDIWSFGCVLYEMLTGRRAFSGATVSDTIVSILEREPDWQALPETTPAGVRSLLRRCLQKDRTRRLHDVADAAIEIEEALAGPVSGAQTGLPASTRPPRQRWLTAAGLAGFIVTLVAASGLVWNRARPAAPPVHSPRRFNINLPRAALFEGIVDGNSVGALALSPDGKRFVYMCRAGGRRQLCLRAMDQIEPAPIPGTEGGYNPFWSPDGEWLGFGADGKLKKVPVRGGAPLTLCDARNLRGASWGPDGTILFGLLASGLSRVTATGGTPQVVTTPDSARQENSHRWPQMLPGGRAALFHVLSEQYAKVDDHRIAVLSLDSGQRRDVLSGGLYPRYVAAGHLLYWRGGSIWAVPFDLERLEASGEAFPVLENVAARTGPGIVYFEVSQAGSLVYSPEIEQSSAGSRLAWVDRRGKTELATLPRRAYVSGELSPDGQRLAVIIREAPGKADLWVYDLPRETWIRLTSGDNADYTAWSSDGSRIAFGSARNGLNAPFWINADGGGAAEQLVPPGRGLQWPLSFSPDGTTLAFLRMDPTTSWDVFVVPLEGDRTPRPFLVSSYSEESARFSPNGQWVAYMSNESGQPEVYVRPYPGPGRTWTISREGADSWGLWARSGRELFYRSGRKMMAVPVVTEPGFSAGAPQVLFEGNFTDCYGVTPDGQRFLMVQGSDEEEEPPQIVVIPDWFDELRARLRQARK